MRQASRSFRPFVRLVLACVLIATMGFPLSSVSARPLSGNSSESWPRNPTDGEISAAFENGVRRFNERSRPNTVLEGVSAPEFLKYHAPRNPISINYKPGQTFNLLWVKFSGTTRWLSGGKLDPAFGQAILQYDDARGGWLFELSIWDVGAKAEQERDQILANGVSGFKASPGWSDAAVFSSDLSQNSSPSSGQTQPPGKVPSPGNVLADCKASIDVPKNLRPGDDLSPSATVSSVDGKPVQGVVQEVWYINGSQRSSVKWDGREAAILLQLSCQGHASEVRTTVSPYALPNDAEGTAGASAVAGAGIAGTLALPVPGTGGVGQIPGPDSLDQALAGILIPGLLGLGGMLLGGLFGRGGAPAPPVAPPPVDAPSKPKRPRDDGEQPRTPEKKVPTKEEIAARHKKTLAEIAKANKEAAEANSWWGLFKGTGSNAGKEFKELGTSIKETVSSTAKGIYDAAKDIKQDPSLIWETMKGSAKTVADGMKSASDMAAAAGEALIKGASHAWKNPKDALDRIGKAGKAIYDAVTDPKNIKEFIKSLTGFTNFEKSLDPSKSLVERIGQVGVGVMSLYGTITMGQAARDLIKSGGSKLLGKKAAATAAGTVERVTAKKAVKGAAGRTAGKAVNSEKLLARGAKEIVDAPPGVLPDVRGIPKSQLKTLEDVAQKRSLDIGVRPPAKDAGAWLESGRAVPKGPNIHNKSISEIDELLGAPANRQGMVGHFKPKLPPKGTVPKSLEKEVMERFEKRIAEFNKYNDDLLRLQKKGDIKIIDGIIHDGKTGKPLVSDVDLAGLFRNGKPIPEDEARMIVNEIRKKCPGVTHPDINGWYAVGQEQKEIMSKTMAGHLQGKTPITTITSGGTKATYFK